MKKIIIISVVVLGLVGLIAWAYVESSKPLPGQMMADEERGHVPVGERVEYHTNPPTSGKHYEDWTKAGVYDQPLDDRNLVHSLEHGYIIISYNCAYPEVDAKFDPESTPSATTMDKFSGDACKKLVNQLKGVFDKKGPHKLIIVPRPNLDAKVALTAWRRLDKFGNFDENRIIKFIDAHRDQGPELTMEP